MIPKIIHYCWLGEDDFPELIKRCIASWKEHLPEYQFMLWDKQRFDIQQNLWVQQAYQKKKYAFAADYIRFYALFHHGGIYLDADVQVLKSFNNLLTNKSFIGLETSGDYEAAIIGAEKECEWINLMLDYYKGRSFVNSDDELDTLPLPSIMTKVFAINYGRVKGLTPPPNLRTELKVYNSEYFSPKNIHTKKINATTNTYCIHHFDGQWVAETLANRAKTTIHRLIIRLLGDKLHTSIVGLIRKFS